MEPAFPRMRKSSAIESRRRVRLRGDPTYTAQDGVVFSPIITLLLERSFPNQNDRVLRAQAGIINPNDREMAKCQPSRMAYP